MNGNLLFIHLVHRLRHYVEAAVLWVLIKEWADVEEFKTSSIRMAYDQLPDTIEKKAAQRAFQSLSARGLISVRIHRKTATLVKVNREAVLELLEGGEEFDQRLPGLSQHTFPLLDAWAAEKVRRAELRQVEADAKAAREAVQLPSEVEEKARKHLEQSSDYDDH